jgi:hypothetical protein
MVLVLMSLTATYGQTGNSDTTRTYTRTELKRIAKKIARANYCDSMLTYSNIQLKQDSLKLASKDKEIHNFTRIGVQNDSIQLGLNNKIKEYKDKESDSTKKIKRLKTGWAITAVFILVENIWFAVRK